MNTSILLGASLLFAAVASNLHLHADPAETKAAVTPATPRDAAARKNIRSVPFRGKVAAIDREKSTFTLSGPKQRVFLINSDTRIEKEGEAATFADLATGDEARGLYQNGEDGQRIVVKASFGPKPDAEARTGAKTKKDPTAVAAGS